jgi:carbamoyltransferase
MGAAAHGNPARFLKKLEQLIPSDPDQIFRMNKDFLNPQDNEHAFIWNKKVNKLFGPPRKKGASLSRRDFDLAAAAQIVFEKKLIQAAKKAKKLTRQKNLIYTGGCAMNCLANASLRKIKVFDKTHVSFAPDDSGNSIGAALAVHSGFKRFNFARIETTFYGPSFEDADIYSLLMRMRLPGNRLKNPSKTAAEYLVKGKILGWFQGRSEFGQRALGNRSILANPQVADIKKTLNLAIKMREGYRPFAPSVLREFACDYFDVVGDPTDYKFMGFTAKLRSKHRKKLLSIVNIDGMSRIQVVSKQDNPLFHQLISSFKNKTNIPMVINTSFNLDGEPIVCSPTDAIRTFYSSGLDALFLGSFILEK